MACKIYYASTEHRLRIDETFLSVGKVQTVAEFEVTAAQLLLSASDGSECSVCFSDNRDEVQIIVTKGDI